MNRRSRRGDEAEFFTQSQNSLGFVEFDLVTSFATPILSLLLLFMLGCALTSNRERAQYYREQVATIFEANCVECHGVDETEAGLDLRTFRSVLHGGAGGPVIVWDQPDESLLLTMVVEGEMPPDGDGLEEEEIETLRRWVAMED